MLALLTFNLNRYILVLKLLREQMGVILQDLLLETVLDHSDLVHLRCLLRGPVNILFSVFVGLGLFNRVPIQLESVDVKFGFLSSWGPCSFSPDCFTYLLTMLDLSE